VSESRLQPGQHYWKVLEPFWTCVSIYDGPDVFQEQFSLLPPRIAVLFAARWLHSEVRNGGFHQFFYNPTGVLAPESFLAFNKLKLDDAAEVIREAMGFFETPYPRDQEQRCVVLDSIPGKNRDEYDPFVQLDKRYYKLVPSSTYRFALAADAFAAGI
jgi:hypothetical protein